MTSDYGFSPDSVFTIQSLGKDWPRMRQHVPPYGKRRKNGHQDHEGHSTAEEDERPPGSEAAPAGPEHKQQSEGFEIII
jgi:hypothetical protein